MELNKIGKFIASCRKNKKLTQEQLAEKLFVTNRAVSKWERGLSLPDADKMLDLCNILGINVNELLNGEKINMTDYDKKMEDLLIELSKIEEIKNKKLITNMYVLVITTLIFYLGIILLAANTLEEGILLDLIVCISTIVFVLISLYAVRIEANTGYYECKKCHHKYIASYSSAILAPHINTTRFLKCPNCNKRTWAKKVMSKK